MSTVPRRAVCNQWPNSTQAVHQAEHCNKGSYLRALPGWPGVHTNLAHLFPWHSIRLPRSKAANFPCTQVLQQSCMRAVHFEI